MTDCERLPFQRGGAVPVAAGVEQVPLEGDARHPEFIGVEERILEVHVAAGQRELRTRPGAYGRRILAQRVCLGLQRSEFVALRRGGQDHRLQCFACRNQVIDVELRVQCDGLIERTIQESVVGRTCVVERVLGLQFALLCVGERHAGGEKVIPGYRAEIVLSLRQFGVRLQRPDIRFGDLEAAFGAENLDVMFAGPELDVLQHGVVLLFRRCGGVLGGADACGYGPAGIQRQADLHAGLQEIVVVEKRLRCRAAAKGEAGRLVELSERAADVQPRPALCLCAVEVEPGGIPARGRCGQLLVRGDGVRPGLMQILCTHGGRQDEDGGKRETTITWFHRHSIEWFIGPGVGPLIN